MKKLIILGSTGSIGTQALDIVRKYPDRFQIVGLSCFSNTVLLNKQAEEFGVKNLAVGIDEAEQLAKTVSADTVLNATVGIAGLKPTMAAINSGKDVALANKETLVSGGDFVMSAAKEAGVKLLPVDSEHSAIWQCLNFGQAKGVKKLILTASGGPFRTTPKSEFAEITLEDALKHPTWSMGKKITVDSATMMNKGLEIIEAMHLFAMPAEKIDVVIHKESYIHSMVMYDDNSIIAQMSPPSMTIPIQLALTYPKRLKSTVPELDFAAAGSMNFEAPDYGKFDCLRIARECALSGGCAPAVMNAANEVAVDCFLKKIIKFDEIPYHITSALDRYGQQRAKSVEDILDIDANTRGFVSKIIGDKYGIDFGGHRA